MKVYIDGKVYSPNSEPIIILFDDDTERIQVSQQIKNMPTKDGLRVYSIFPDYLSLEYVRNVIEKAKKICK